MNNICIKGLGIILIIISIANIAEAQDYIPDNYEGNWSGVVVNDRESSFDVRIDVKEAGPGEAAGTITIGETNCAGNLYFVRTYKNTEGILVSEFRLDKFEGSSECPSSGNIEFSSHFRKPIFYLKWVTPTFSASSEVRRE